MKKNITFKNIELSGGTLLPEVNIVYNTYGKLNKTKDNVIWVCHALTADSNVCDWWSGLFGENRVLDPQKYFIVCANVIGSSYGSTNPWSPETPEGLKGWNFPLITIVDIVQGHQLLAESIGVEQIQMLIGPSLGGQQALEWAVDEPNRIQSLCVIAANAKHSPWGVAFNESQRLALWSDESFRSNHREGGKFGLKAARSIALLSYRSHQAYNETQQEGHDFKCDHYLAASYQNYQGDKLVSRFNPFSYWTLSKAMDSHNVGRGRISIVEALESIKSKTLIIGVDSDVLFPLEEQAFLAKHIPKSCYKVLNSKFGHDGFLIESERINKLILDFLDDRLTPLTLTNFKTNILN